MRAGPAPGHAGRTSRAVGPALLTRSYTVPQTRNTLSDGRELFAETAQVTLFVDGGGVLVSIGSADVSCEDRTHTFTFSNGDARYKVKALVQVQDAGVARQH